MRVHATKIIDNIGQFAALVVIGASIGAMAAQVFYFLKYGFGG